MPELRQQNVETGLSGSGAKGCNHRLPLFLHELRTAGPKPHLVQMTYINRDLAVNALPKVRYQYLC
jgi:hypothetical protein